MKTELRGIQRIPSLLFHSPSVNAIINLHLENYEVCSVEPMHDIAGHTKNILLEYSHILDEEEREIYKKAYEISFGQKDNIRACDYHRGLIELTLVMNNYISDYETLELLLTLIEIQHILYASAGTRTPRQILKLHNMTFRRFNLMKQIFKNKLVTVTRNKLFRKYFHNLMIHVSLQYRIISGSSINCEDEERIFNLLKSITTRTSSNHPGHVIGNLILRYQAESKMKENVTSSYKNDIEKNMSA